MLSVPPDYLIAQKAQPEHINKLAERIGIPQDELVAYGDHYAKVKLSLQSKLANAEQGSYVVVTGINPTPFGEGKTTSLVGISQAIGAHLGKKVFSCIRQPSMGPTFGIKGGAAGGGYSQVIPMEDFNLHLTGDIHAVSAANNLLAAAIDTRIFHENTQLDGALWRRLVPENKEGKKQFAHNMKYRLEKLNLLGKTPDELTESEINEFVRLDIDPDTITWKRVVDMNDRFLREIEIGHSPTEKGMIRRTGFEISVASEVMAVLAMSKNLRDLRGRIEEIVVAQSKRDGSAVTAGDLGVAGAMAICLKDALQPTLMQTLEKTPVFVHCGPFANIAHGNSSIIADALALRLVGKEGFVLTEAGFGSDIGMEKFINIKCRASGLVPAAAVLVVTIRALKMHGDGPPVKPGSSLPREYVEESLDLLSKGLCNMLKHLENGPRYGIQVCVAINRFPTDTEREISLVVDAALKAGAFSAVPISSHMEGGKGAVDLAKSLVESVKVSRRENSFKFFYTPEDGIKFNINKIAKEIYGADGCDFSPHAEEQLESCISMGFGSYPICVAKTHLSLSEDPPKKGLPRGWRLHVKEIKISAGARYIVLLCGSMMMIPGLPTLPNYYHIDLKFSEDGNLATIIGLD